MVYYRKAAFCCAFLWGKIPNAKGIHNEMFSAYGGKCLSRKAVHSWVANISLMTKRLKRRCRSAETKVKRLLCCGFRRTGKAMGQVYQCWWRICREINVFFRVQISHVLSFISICDLFPDTPSYVKNIVTF
jgi:hypothetical protein